MSDIELVIKIPEWQYKSICEGVEASKRCGVVGIDPNIHEAIYNGTPLNEVLDKIKAEIREFSVVDESGTYRISTYLVDQIIDKYRGEVDCRECKAEYECYECKKYEESEDKE